MRLAMVLSMLAIALYAGGQARTPKGAIERKLPNGVRVLVLERPAVPLVALDIWVRGGSSSELPDECGAAHFLEHMIFKGTPTRGPGEVDAAIEDLGAVLNAGTTRDAAHYFTTVAAEHWETALGVVADALRNPVLDVGEMERERTVILDEMLRAADDNDRAASDRLFRALFAGDPYERSILGETDGLRALTRDRLAAYYRRVVRPDLTTIVLVGRVTPDAAAAAVERAFGSWIVPPGSDGSAVRSLLPSDASPAPQAGRASGPSAVLAIGFRVPPEPNGAHVATSHVLAALLGDPIVGRLAPKLAPLCRPSDIHCSSVPLARGALLIVSVACEPTRVDAVRDAVWAELERLARTVPTGLEVEAARRRLLGGVLFETETCGGEARFIGESDIVGRPVTVQAYRAAVNGVKPAEISSAAKARCEPAGRTEVVLNPGGAR